MDLVCGKMIFYKPPLSILILNRRYALSDMTLKIFPLPSKHLNYTYPKEVDSVLNQNTINTIYSIYKNSKSIL
jgi:hypothetical protein